MDIGLLQVLSKEQLNTLFNGIHKAFDEHVRLACRCQGTLLSAIQVDEEILDESSHLKCNFGKWYNGPLPEGLRKSEEFQRLGALHEKFHEAARNASLVRVRGEELTVELCENLLTAQSDLLLALNHYLRHEIGEADQLFDPLTGLLNRLEMGKLLARETARAKRYGTRVSIAMADLDHFKKVNDMYGHEAGDMVLREAAALFSANLRPYDLLFRYGGEEFLFCFPDADLQEAYAVCERMRKAIENNKVEIGGGNFAAITVSFGIAPLDLEKNLQASLREADRALYEAKSKGRNRVSVTPYDRPSGQGEAPSGV